MTKCDGCGCVLQNIDQSKEGYTEDLKNSLCQRCFRIVNYNDYKMVSKKNEDFIEILKQISLTNDLVILVVDLLNISRNLDIISRYITNNALLVLSKRDLLPKNIYEEKLLKYLDINCLDKIVISSKTNYNLDLLMEKINKYKKSNRVYVVGITNAGKSSLINKLIYNYSNLERFITTSNLPSTTLNTIEIQLNDNLTLIDTPGIIDSGNIVNYISTKEIKKVIPQKQIKPITYQIKTKQTLIVDSYLRIDLNDNNITLFLSNNLKIQRFYKETTLLNSLKKHQIKATSNMDIVVTGLGFIKVSKSSTIVLYTIDGIDVYTRKSLI